MKLKTLAFAAGAAITLTMSSAEAAVYTHTVWGRASGIDELGEFGTAGKVYNNTWYKVTFVTDTSGGVLVHGVGVSGNPYTQLNTPNGIAGVHGPLSATITIAGQTTLINGDADGYAYAGYADSDNFSPILADPNLSLPVPGENQGLAIFTQDYFFNQNPNAPIGEVNTRQYYKQVGMQFSSQTTDILKDNLGERTHYSNIPADWRANFVQGYEGNFYADFHRIVINGPGVNQYTEVDQTTAFLFTPIGFSSNAPEPGTWAVMLVGLGGVGAVLRQRRTRVLA